MKKVLVTGASGFIGKNLCSMLDRENEIEVLRFTRENSSDDLCQMVSSVDFIFHIAGVNRPLDESDYETHNHQLTDSIIDCLKESGKTTPILITSSSQANLDNSYGKSKKAAEDSLIKWSKESGSLVYIYRLPGVFGKWSRPNYNSVVATFCHNIARDKEITVSDPEKVLTLVYIDDVVNEFLRALAGEVEVSPSSFYDVQPQFEVPLGDIADKLKYIKDSREKLIVPNFEEAFDRNLYATFTSYFDQDDVGYLLDKKEDERGWLAEFIKSKQFGQIYVSRTNPGFTRGIHWHNTKIEKFLVFEGEAEIKLRQLHSNKVETYQVSGEKLEVIEMPAGYVHSIKNIGETDMFLLIWSQQVFDPQHPDTYFQEV